MDDNNNQDDNNKIEPKFDALDSDIEFGKCPMCKTETFDLEPVDDYIKDSLSVNNDEVIFDFVCNDCFLELKDKVSQAGRLQAEQKQKLESLLSKWNSKIDILKKGRALMSQNIYSEAKKYYEEYIHILEAVFNNGNIGLLPNMIPQEHRKQEATLICSVLCDLIYIYDQYEQGTAKLKYAGDYLVKFLPYSRGQGNTISKIKKLQVKSKNPNILNELYKQSQNKKNGCFIATAVFDDPEAIELTLLRNFRDYFLKKYTFGRQFIYFYYKFSPQFVSIFKNNKTLKLVTRRFLQGLTKLIAPFF